MKILNKIWGVSLLALLLIVAAPHKSTAQDQYISEQDFYDNLAPYGTWVYDQQYGDVWVPDVDSDFRPYATQGHWVLTEYGNTWVSDYPWGWATFHYGRWIYDDYYGWEWIPGYEWAPAWVTWRHGGGYYGWAPLMPGISVDLSFSNNYNVPDYYWAFAPQAYINSANIYNYYVPYNRTTTIIKRTAVVRNTFVRGGVNYIAGPRAAEIQRYTKRRPSVYSINNSNRPGAITVQNRSVNMFRPSIRRASDARPERVVDANAYKQQNPNQSIARRGAGGAVGFNRNNAAKLAAIARNSNDNVVKVNRPAASQQRNNPNQNDNRQIQRTPITQPTLLQNNNRPVFTPNRGQDNQVNDLKQKEQQIRSEQKAVRQQRRDQIIRESQEAGLPQTPQPPSIYGQTPLQQQQMAVRDQKRQLQRQQQDAQQAQQKVQQDQQRLRFEQQKQAQQTAQQQQQAQQKEQQRQQADQQRQAQQAAQQQQQAQQKEQQRQQAEQQRQAQQAAQQQQRQAAQQAQQAAQAQQKEQQRQQADQQRQAQQAQQAQQRQAAQQAQQQQREAQRAKQQQQQQSQQRRPPVRPNQQ
jgi:hypothetical protein